MIVGLASYRFINNDLHFNLSQMERGLEAARGKASLLVFGEAFLQGFHAMNWCYEQDRNVAITQESAIMQSLRKMTVDYGVDLLVGYLEKEGERLFSSCILIAQGEIAYNYRRISQGWKQYWMTDSHYCEGNSTRDFCYRGKTFRIALCGDLWDMPERFRTNGTLLWPVCCNFTREEWETQYLTEYLAQANKVAKKTLFVDALETGTPCVPAAFCFTPEGVAASLFDVTADILYVEI